MANFALRSDADTTHEDAREWYGSYGWHMTTENAGDVELQAVEYDWLDGTNADAVAKLLADDSDLTDDEAESIVEMARTVRDAAESIESMLNDAVTAYEAGDIDAVLAALESCRSSESDHGDSPASQSLRAALVEEWDRDALIAEIEAENLESPEQVADMVLGAAKTGGMAAGRAELARCVANG